ncbi:hypothetical protein MMC20_006892 [Loxospora ochrophaea]|nr:hypothetical protein [Loxospora ochrophaea]
MSHPERFYYDHLNPAPRSKNLPISGARSRSRSKQRWPPRPLVEDEAISLSHEHALVPKAVDLGEVQSRGTVDQQPIILDAYPRLLHRTTGSRTESSESDTDETSLKSRSSSESLGPQTPPETINSNPDRRYVYIPQKGIEIPLTYDNIKSVPKGKHDQKDGSKVESQRVQNLDKETANAHKEHASSLHGREPSPYTFAPASSKSGSLDEPAPVPNPLTPRHSKHQDLNPNQSAFDAHNENSPQIHGGHAKRPTIGRHVSAMEFSSESRSPMKQSTLSQHIEVSSESDSEHEDLIDEVHGRTRRRDLPTRPERPRQASAIRYDEAVQQVKDVTSLGQQPILPTLRSVTRSDMKLDLPQVPLHSGFTLPILSNASHIDDSTRPPLPPRHERPDLLTSEKPTSSPISTKPLLPPRPLPLDQASILPNGPRFDNVNNRVPSTSKGSGSHDNSRPPSPISIVQKSHMPFDSESRVDPYSPDHHDTPDSKSRHESPLPSPGAGRPSTKVRPRIDVRGPSPVNDQSRSISDNYQRPRSRDSSSIPVQSTNPKSTERRTERTSQQSRPSFDVESHDSREPFFSRQFSQLPVSPPSKLHPLTSHTATAHTSVKEPPPLPQCPRPSFVAGYDDWYTLAGCSTFDICPTCRRAVIDSGYGTNLTPSPPRPDGWETRCVFSIPWVRMAWLLTVQKKSHHLTLLYSIADVLGHEAPCPNRIPMVAKWYRLYDSENRKNVHNFYACSCCIRSLETIFPLLKGAFRPAGVADLERSCDLGADTKRFATYVDMLEEINSQAKEHRRPPNLLRFIQLARKWSSVPICTKDDMILGQPWHFMPRLREFTVCEECYIQVVRPAIDDGSSLASDFTRTPQKVAPAHIGISCQLYSERMRDIFQKACDRDEFQYLRVAAVQRYTMERDLQRRHAEVTADGYEDRAEELAALIDEWKEWE